METWLRRFAVSIGLVVGFFLGVAAGVHGVLEALRVSPSYHIEDGKADTLLRFRLGPFTYTKTVAPEAPADAQR